MLLYVVTICAAVIFCALSAPLYALPGIGAGIVSGSALPALSGSAVGLSAPAPAAVWVSVSVCPPRVAAPRGALCCSVCPPPLGAGIVSGSALPALSGSPCTRSGSAPGRSCRPQRLALPPL